MVQPAWRASCMRQLGVMLVVMTLYSALLLHSTNKLRLLPRRQDSGQDAYAKTKPGCTCTPESLAAVTRGASAVLSLSTPYRYFESNHWFHIGEYYLPRHASVAHWLPRNGTLYILAPSDVFVEKLVVMTFFLLLLAFTDGTTRRVEVLPRGTVTSYVTREVIALDRRGATGYTYDASRPVFDRIWRRGGGAEVEDGGMDDAGGAASRRLLAGAANQYFPGDLALEEDLEEDLEDGAPIAEPWGKREEGRRIRELSALWGGLPWADAAGSGSSGGRRRRRRRTAASFALHQNGSYAGEDAWREGEGQAGTQGMQRRKLQCALRPAGATAGAAADAAGYAGAAAIDPRGADGGRRSGRRRASERAGGSGSETGSEGGPPQTCACARYVGDYASAPVERGFWFGDGRAVRSARARIDAICGNTYRNRRRAAASATGALPASGPSEGEEGAGQRRRLVIYQRDYSRRLVDVNGVQAALQRMLGSNWEVPIVVHSDKEHPCKLFELLSEADLLLTPHGFQSMLLLFLPPGAALFEVFPYKYWKEGYAPLATEWGVTYDFIMSRSVAVMRGLVLFFVPQDACMRNIYCRKFSRADDVRLEELHLKAVAQAARRAAAERTPYLY